MADKNKSRAFRLAPLASAVAAAVLSTSALAVEFHGYMRAGIGNNLDGGGQVCYGNGGPNGHMVGRLGDECDMYLEASLSEELYSRDGVSFKVHTTIAYGTEESSDVPQMASYGNSWQAQGSNASSPWDGGRMSVREVYISSKGILGDSTTWMGKRFGQRKDVHLMDYFYLMNSGYGAGFDGLSAGPGKLSFNWTQAFSDSGTPAFPDYDWNTKGLQDVVNGSTKSFNRLNKLETRYNVPVAGQNMEFIGIYGKPSLTDAQDQAGDFDKSSILLMAEHSTGLMGGFNKFSVTYATNVFQNLRDGFWGLNNGTWLGEGKGVGVLDHGVVKLSRKVELGYAFLYTKTSPDDNKGNAWFEEKSLTAVLRPQYKWDDIMSTIVEAGYDKVDYEDQSHQDRIGGESLYKITLAQAWSPLMNGGFWARPQMRLFVSHYGGDRAVKDADTMFGAQVEAWW